MKKDIKRSVFVGVIMLVLMLLAIFIHTKTLDTFVWKGAQVWIEVCYPGGADITVYKCEDAGCIDKNTIFSVISDSSPTKAFIILKATGLYAITNGDDYREFIVTRMSPDRYEYFGCDGK